MHQIGIERLKISVFPLFGKNSEFKFSEIFFGGGGGGSEKHLKKYISRLTQRKKVPFLLSLSLSLSLTHTHTHTLTSLVVSEARK